MVECHKITNHESLKLLIDNLFLTVSSCVQETVVLFFYCLLLFVTEGGYQEHGNSSTSS